MHNFMRALVCLFVEAACVLTTMGFAEDDQTWRCAEIMQTTRKYLYLYFILYLYFQSLGKNIKKCDKYRIFFHPVAFSLTLTVTVSAVCVFLFSNLSLQYLKLYI